MSLKTKISPKLVSLLFGVLVIIFLISFYIFAWEEASEDPPGGNAPLPLNVSINGQIKEGGLTLNFSGGDDDDGLIIANGYIQIGSVDSSGTGPDSSYCDDDSERGRMILDYSFTPDRLFICKGDSGTGDLGWSYIEL